ncbi:hypothetical protein KIW84_021975 [Lathyrus oleraceus]|uniref:Uncharacterized protein n=1 Tax=Pisum sativum TaxID=3888 RepID=A0A9D4YD80_PEA|nr:hypothetical protein KIW84_021975 [Pisum sativum]
MNSVLDCGYERNKFRVLSKLEGISDCYFEINNDHCVIDVATYVVGNSIDGHLYVEHNVKDIMVKVVEPQCIDVTVRNESSDKDVDESDDDAKNVRFDDSGEDRTTRLNDGFEYIEVDRPKEDSNRVDINGKSYRIKMCESKSPMKKKKLTPKKKIKVKVKVMSPAKKSKDATEEKDHKSKDDREDQCVSDELGSSDPDASEAEKLPKYEKFRKEQLGKDYEFKLGTEFNSLTDFKDAIIEWSVVNGREITFVMNESNMRKTPRHYAKKAKVITGAIEVPLTTGAVKVLLATGAVEVPLQ